MRNMAAPPRISPRPKSERPPALARPVLARVLLLAVVLLLELAAVVLLPATTTGVATTLTDKGDVWIRKHNADGQPPRQHMHVGEISGVATGHTPVVCGFMQERVQVVHVAG